MNPIKGQKHQKVFKPMIGNYRGRRDGEAGEGEDKKGRKG